MDDLAHRRAALAGEFARRGPWVTRYRIDGGEFGGTFACWKDRRLTHFAEAFPGARTVLELGSLEGGHSFELAGRAGVERVVAIEGRVANVRRARFVQEVLGRRGVEFIVANLEGYRLRPLGRFDVVFCTGLLYHLPRPWLLLREIAAITDHLFLWTHFVHDETAVRMRETEKAHTKRSLLRRAREKIAPPPLGYTYPEQGVDDPLSGLSDTSFWPTLKGLRLMLARAGFADQRILELEPDHPHAGPAVTMAASRETVARRIGSRRSRGAPGSAPGPHPGAAHPVSPRLVTIGVVTWNSAADIEACLAGVRAQTWPRIELYVADNASSDRTRAVLERATEPRERVDFDLNRGFAAAHNAIIRRSLGEFYLSLNPDVTLEPGYVARLVEALDGCPGAGSATGKLLRADPPAVLDSTGIVMTREQRHLDRGAEQADRGQYERPGEVFGASGAAALYRRAMLEDVQVLADYFDEDFFAYREDADLAWRARLNGWTCLYVPSARAVHVRHVTPGRRDAVSAAINRHSVRNRFLLRLKNQPAGHAVRFLLPALLRDAQVVGYVVLREWTSLPALVDLVRLLPRTLRKRSIIMRRRTLSSAELARWFLGERSDPETR